MDDVVAIVGVDSVRGRFAVLTWGRVYDAVDPAELLRHTEELLGSRLGMHSIQELDVCESLSAVRNHTYFYEGLLSFAAEMHAGDFRSEAWRERMKLKTAIYLLGPQEVAE